MRVGSETGQQKNGSFWLGFLDSVEQEKGGAGGGEWGRAGLGAPGVEQEGGGAGKGGGSGGGGVGWNARRF